MGKLVTSPRNRAGTGKTQSGNLGFILDNENSRIREVFTSSDNRYWKVQRNRI